jgi:hypothetical protein
VVGAAVVGTTLSAGAGIWGPSGVTFRYQWSRDGTAIPAALASTYVVQTADGGHQLSVTVTGSKTGYFSVTRTSPVVRVSLCVHASAWALGCVQPKTRGLSRASGIGHASKPVTVSAGEGVGAVATSSSVVDSGDGLLGLVSRAVVAQLERAV